MSQMCAYNFNEISLYILFFSLIKLGAWMCFYKTSFLGLWIAHGVIALPLQRSEIDNLGCLYLLRKLDKIEDGAKFK